MIGRCLFHETNNIKKYQALKEQSERDRVGTKEGDPDYVHKFRKFMEPYDEEYKGALHRYDKRNKVINQMQSGKCLTWGVRIDPSCYERDDYTIDYTDQNDTS